MKAMLLGCVLLASVIGCSDDSKKATDATTASDVTTPSDAADATTPADATDAADVAPDADAAPTAAEKVMAIPESARFVVPGLEHDVQVVRSSPTSRTSTPSTADPASSWPPAASRATAS
ncbi:MAG: hypothetical protein U1F43_12050 [Myxococcota bacterium]